MPVYGNLVVCGLIYSSSLMSITSRTVWAVPQTGALDNLTLATEDLPLPLPHHARVRVTAIGLNFADVFAILGLYSATPQGRFVPGLEFAGVVEALGEGLVEAGWMNARVYGVTRFGGYATYINADSKYLKKTPADWSDQQACAFAVQAVTAYYSLYPLGNLQTGQCVLVHSAAGGVGLLALSILQKRSAKIVGTVGNPRKLDFLRSHHPDPNATFILRDPASNFEARARQALASLLSNEGEDEEGLKAPEFDIILDSVMGDWFWPNYRLLRKAGRMVLFGSGAFTPQGNLHPVCNLWAWLRLGWQYVWRPKVDPMKLVTDNKSIMGFNLIHIYDRVSELNRIFAELESLHLDPPVVGHTYPFERLPEALRFMQSGKSVGKIVVEV